MNLGQKLGVGLGSTALAIGGVFGVTQAAHYYASGQTQSAQRGGMQGGPGGMGGAPGAQSSAGTSQNGAGAAAPSGAATGAAPSGAATGAAPTGAAPTGAAPTGAAPTGAAGAQGGAPAELVSTIASTFNLSTDKVQTAVDDAFTKVQSQNLQPGDAMDSAIAKQLASSLSIDEAKVKTVLVNYRSTLQDQGQPGAAPTGSTGNG